MKNIILVFVSLMLILTPVSQSRAQAAIFVLIFGDKVASENFHLSLDIGVNISNMSGYDDGKGMVGMNFGLGTHIKFNDRWFLAPEIKPVSRKGARDVTNPIKPIEGFDVSETNSRIKLNYLEIPILVQYRLQSGWYFSAGPQLSFLTSANQETEIILTNGTTVDVEQGIQSKFKDFDWAFPVEIGYAFKDKRGGKGMDIRARYSYGFNEIFEDDTGFSSNHSTFQFIATFPFVETKEGK